MKLTRRRPMVCLVVLCGASFLSACAAPKPAADEPQGPSNRSDTSETNGSLERTSWVLAEVAGRPARSSEMPTARFESGQVRGTDGCNRYSSPFTAAGATLTIGPGDAMTQMACPPEVMAQAQSFRDALRNSRQFRIVNGQLELLSAEGATLAILAPQPTTVVGTWDVTALNNGRQAVVGVLENAPIEITFGPEDRVSGSAGCNRFTATFKAEGAAFRFGPAATTRRMCPGDGVMEQEQAFINALSKVATMRMEADGIEFRTADDALALMLRRRR